MIHETPISVRFYELDPYRHLNHSVYIQYFEVGRIDLFRALGWTLSGLADMGTQVFATTIETSFVAPAVEGDDLVVESWVEELKRVTGRFGQRIVRGDQVIATQTVYAACVNANGRPMRWPTEMTDGLAGYLVES